MGVRIEVSEWARSLRGTGYRGLAVVHSSDIGRGVEGLVAGAMDAGAETVACIAAGYRERVEGCTWFSAAGIERLLGREFDAVVIAAPGFLAPNTVAAAAEAVKGGGFLGLAVPPLSYWEPGGSASTGTYRRYIIESFRRAESMLWVDADQDRVLLERLPPTAPPRRVERTPSRSGVPRKLMEAAATVEQMRALDEAVGAIRRRVRSIVVLGDRGRGKSGLLALIVAYLISRHEVGFVSVTAPSVWNVQSFFRVLAMSLERLVDRWWAIHRGDAVIGIAGPWFHVRYHTPESVEPGSYTVVDEAAALGGLRLRRIVRRATRLLVATTVHGYEGSGRVFAKLVVEMLPQPRLVLELREPVRYPPGDPLERWLNSVFMLDAEAPEPPRQIRFTAYLEVDRVRLASDMRLLKSIYGLLAQAHYRNEPNDLALMIDAPHHSVRVVVADGTPIAAAQLAVEDCSMPYEWRRLVDLLSHHSSSACNTRGLRVVRIAVHPEFQRRGIGSRLLRSIEYEAASKGFDWVGAVYGRVEVTRFWLANGYMVVYVSPLPSKATGEKNVAVAKPLTARGRRVVEEAATWFRLRLLYTASTTYRDLPAEVVASILTTLVRPMRPPLTVTWEQSTRLRRLVEGDLDVEAATDALWAAAVVAVSVEGRLPLEGREAVAFTARIVQGRTIEDTAAILGLNVDETRELVRRASRRIAERVMRSVIEG